MPLSEERSYPSCAELGKARHCLREPKVEVVAIFPEDSHSPIIYPEALVTAGTNPNASNFLSFLSSPEDGEIFELQGFTA